MLKEVCDDMFSRFDAIAERGRQTYRYVSRRIAVLSLEAQLAQRGRAMLRYSA